MNIAAGVQLHAGGNDIASADSRSDRVSAHRETPSGEWFIWFFNLLAAGGCLPRRKPIPPRSSMKKRVSVTLSLLTVAFALPSGAFAQAVPSPVKVTVMAGATLPMGSVDDLYDLGYNFAGGVEFAPAMIPFGMRAELGYTRLGAETLTMPDGEGGQISVTPKLSNLAVTLNAILGPTVPSTQIRPYAIAGIGFYNTSEGGSISGGGFDLSGSESKGSLGFNGGGGVRFQFVGFSSFIEARYHHVTKGEIEESEDPNAPTRWKSAAYLPISFGISFGGR